MRIPSVFVILKKFTKIFFFLFFFPTLATAGGGLRATADARGRGCVKNCLRMLPAVHERWLQIARRGQLKTSSDKGDKTI
jgi:hypothetical protein